MAQVQINLLTKEFSKGGASLTDALVRWLVIFAFLAVIVLGALQFMELYSLNGEQASAQAELDAQRKRVAETQKLQGLEDGVKKSQEIIKKIHNSGQTTNSIMDIVASKTPSGVFLKSESIKGGTVELRLDAISIIEVEKFIDSLKTEKSFSDLDLQALSQETGKPVQAAISFKYGKGAQGK